MYGYNEYPLINLRAQNSLQINTTDVWFLLNG